MFIGCFKQTRKNNAGTIIQTMKVPLAYGPKQKWLSRLDADANLNTKVAITLPRLGFEIQNLSYDPARKLNRVQKFKKVKSSSDDSNKLDSQFMPVPYNLDMELYAIARVCFLENVPLIAWKYISDNADGNSSSDWKKNVRSGTIAFKSQVIEWIKGK